MSVDPSIHFIQRKYPSANMVLVHDQVPMLFDSGFGSDDAETMSLVKRFMAPCDLQAIVNTHYHSEQVGGNHLFQKKFKTEIVAHAWDIDLVNQKQANACASEWLNQPVEKYHIDKGLKDLDAFSTGTYTFQALHTPGH